MTRKAFSVPAHQLLAVFATICEDQPEASMLFMGFTITSIRYADKNGKQTLVIKGSCRKSTATRCMKITVG